MRHAVLDGYEIINIIEIDPRNASDFGSAVSIPEGVGAGIGDSYEDGRFYRTNPETGEKTEILPYDPLAAFANQTAETIAALQSKLDETTIDSDFRLLMLENQ